MNILLWNPALQRPYEGRLRARISLAQNELSTDFSKLSSQWGGVGVANVFPTQRLPLSARFLQDFNLWLSDLSRKSDASCRCCLLLIYIQIVTPEGDRSPVWGERHLLPQRSYGLNTCHFGPLFAKRSVCVWNSSYTRLSPFISSISPKHKQAVMPFLPNLLVWHF